jgi:antitoxin component YwqK of YwqJK toxin-antitoxin module
MVTRPKAVAEVVRYPSGILKMRGSRLGGEMHGAWKWFRLDGSVMRTGRFDRGKQVGVWKTFERSGRLVKETNFTKRP